VPDAQKLKFFTATLKSVTLQWLMGLGKDNICSWGQIMKKFLDKYQYYCKDKEREDVFRMMQHEDDTLEDYVERFT
jgi:hypothetical protein